MGRAGGRTWEKGEGDAAAHTRGCKQVRVGLPTALTSVFSLRKEVRVGLPTAGRSL